MECQKHKISLNIFWSLDNHYITTCNKCNEDNNVSKEE
jgi:hypothetical protein